MSAANKWLVISIPIQAILMLSELITGLNSERIPPGTYEIVHEGGGILLVTMVVIHAIINWPWIRSHYFTRNSQKKS